MSRLLLVLFVAFLPSLSFGQDWFWPAAQVAVHDFTTSQSAQPRSDDPQVQPRLANLLDWNSWGSLGPQRADDPPADFMSQFFDADITQGDDSIFHFAPAGDLVIRGQSPSGEGGGGGAGAAAATDPSVPLTQLQLQNVFTPETYDASGYSNTFIVQPVIPLNIGEDAFFPYHIVRPTLPIIGPTADPDGPIGVHGGLGDTTIVDAFIHPIEELKTNVGIGYVAVLPTRTYPVLGRGEWQLGPSAVVISRAVPKWIVGGLVEAPFSLESDAYAVQLQAIALRLLPNEWFIGWGDQILKLNDQNGGYELPLSLQLGKVAKVGQTPMKLFIEPIYTPEGLRSGPGGAKWSIKLNLTILFPEAKFYAPLLKGLGSRQGHHCCR